MEADRRHNRYPPLRPVCCYSIAGHWASAVKHWESLWNCSDHWQWLIVAAAVVAVAATAAAAAAEDDEDDEEPWTVENVRAATPPATAGKAHY